MMVERMKMRAYCCFVELPADGCLLVLAKDRNRARYLASKSIWGDQWEYTEISARVANPFYDDMSDVEKVYESNNDLPERWRQLLPFYSEEEYV
jgi:hypothetical protein